MNEKLCSIPWMSTVARVVSVASGLAIFVREHDSSSSLKIVFSDLVSAVRVCEEGTLLRDIGRGRFFGNGLYRRLQTVAEDDLDSTVLGGESSDSWFIVLTSEEVIDVRCAVEPSFEFGVDDAAS